MSGRARRRMGRDRVSVDRERALRDAVPGEVALDAASAGAFLHGLAGLEAMGEPAAPFTAMDIATHLQGAVRTVRG